MVEVTRPSRAFIWVAGPLVVAIVLVAELRGLVPDGTMFLLAGSLFVVSGVRERNASAAALGGWMAGMGSVHMAQWLGKHVLTRILLVATLALLVGDVYAEEDCRNEPPTGRECGCTDLYCSPDFGSDSPNAVCCHEQWCGGENANHAALYNSCHVEFGFGTKPRLSDEIKKSDKLIGNTMAYTAKGMAGLALVAKLDPDPQAQVVSVAIGLVGIGLGTLADIVKSTDPYDPDWRLEAIAEPTPFVFEQIAELRPGVRDAFQRLGDNEAALEAHYTALQLSINRANSAKWDSSWYPEGVASEKMQVAAIARHVDTLADLFAAEVVLRQRLKRAWSGAGYKPIWNADRTASWPQILVNAKLISQYKMMATKLRREVAPR